MFKLLILPLVILLSACKPEETRVQPPEDTVQTQTTIFEPRGDNSQSMIIRENTTVNPDGSVTTTEVKRASEECVNESNSLISQYSTTGVKVRNLMGDEKESFEIWFNCDDTDRTMMLISMTTAIHESVHYLTDVLNAYPLINNSKAPMVDSDSLPPPHKVNYLFNKKETLVEIYLTEGDETASSSDHFNFLLNEMNAYAFDLKSVIEFIPYATGLKEGGNSFRDGTAAMMAFTAAYVNSLKNTSHWDKLVEMKPTIKVLWDQSEAVFNESCKYPFLGGTESEEDFKKVMRAQQDGINTLLGRRIKLDC